MHQETMRFVPPGPCPTPYLCALLACRDSRQRLCCMRVMASIVLACKADERPCR